MRDWKEIETAPTDGSLFIGYRRTGTTTYPDGSELVNFWVRECRWQDGQYRAERPRLGAPTHWIPILYLP